MQTLISIAVAMGLGLVTFLATAPAVQLLWGWFVAPVFGMAVPSFGAIIGLLLCVSLIRVLMVQIDPSKPAAHYGELTYIMFIRLVAVWFVVAMGLGVKVLFI